ncbi:MAG TPA: succinate dehydrogenase, cytochrome b556 subunit [Steroidobacteraceae bacterium]|nr:succinate dehydrogenase, cytochrome b556 subunit [Steroidobacteraceae bacterium]
MAQPERPLSPFLHYRWQYTNTFSILHRITGELLSFCFFLLVYWLVAAARGPEAYAGALRCLGSPLTQLVLAGGLFAFCYHLLCGIRHLFFDVGKGFELATARKSAWGVAIGAVVLTAVTWAALHAALGGGA